MTGGTAVTPSSTVTPPSTALPPYPPIEAAEVGQWAAPVGPERGPGPPHPRKVGHTMSQHSGGTVYRAAPRSRLTPQQVREQRFGRAGFAQRGLDARDVHRFLDLVADDLAALHAELALVRDENERIKQALRQWQARQGGPDRRAEQNRHAGRAGR